MVESGWESFKSHFFLLRKYESSEWCMASTRFYSMHVCDGCVFPDWDNISYVSLLSARWMMPSTARSDRWRVQARARCGSWVREELKKKRWKKVKGIHRIPHIFRRPSHRFYIWLDGFRWKTDGSSDKVQRSSIERSNMHMDLLNSGGRHYRNTKWSLNMPPWKTSPKVFLFWGEGGQGGGCTL